MIATIGYDIIHPRERFVALPLYMDSKLRSLIAQTGNVLKTSFPLGRYYSCFSDLGIPLCRCKNSLFLEN